MLKLCTSLEDLQDFPDDIALSILERKPDESAQVFFDILMQDDFTVEGFVSDKNAVQDITNLLDTTIPDSLKAHIFYMRWIEDMADICRIFCHLQMSHQVSFWLGTKRGCKRFHVDYVPMRLLVTYAGHGTQWLPHDAADWDAYKNGAANEEICKDPSKIEAIQPWDVAVFRGQDKGLLHKTPDHAICCPSIFMRIDNAEHKKRLQSINEASFQNQI